MERWLGLVAGLLLLAAGCLGDEDAPTNETDDGNVVPTDRPPLPNDIEASEMVVGGADPFNFVTMAPCSTPVSGCYPYAFEANTSVTITAALSWTVPANDFDVYLFDEGGTAVAMSAGMPPGTSEGFAADLDPGSYSLTVVAWAVTQDTFTLTGTFGYAEEVPAEEAG